MKITMYFIRHGETYLNKYKRMQGWADAPLTAQGEEIARRTGNLLSNIKFDAVYSSDLGRTIQTAKIILEENQYCSQLEVQPKKNFRESFFGYFEGATQSEAYETFAKKAGRSLKELFQGLTLEEFMNVIKCSDPYHEAENYTELWERLDKGLEEILHLHKDAENSKVLVVTHGNVIRNIFTKMDSSISPAEEIMNASISTLVFENNAYYVDQFNRTEV
jgi:Fructose-2,6-bisphosphatase